MELNLKVYETIGTSPLCTLKTVLALPGGKPDRAVILGTLSLVILPAMSRRSKIRN
jgi:K+ transporter